MAQLMLKQFRLEGIYKDKDSGEYKLIDNSYPLSLSDWCDGTMGNHIGAAANKSVYSLAVYGKPGTLFYLNDNIFPVEIGPSGYYALELGEIATITKLEFDEDRLKLLYITDKDNNIFIPLVVDVKVKSYSNQKGV